MTAKLERVSGGRRLVIYERRSLELSQEQWRVLERIARNVRAHATGGPRTGKASWRALVREIADGRVEVRG